MGSSRDGHSPKADRALGSEAFGHRSQAHDGILECFVQCQELDLIILMGPFQLSRVYGSVFLWEEPGFAFLVVSSAVFPSQSAQTAGSTRAVGSGFFVALTFLPAILPSVLWFPAVLSCLCCVLCLSLETGSPQSSSQIRYLPGGSCSQRLLHSAPHSCYPQPSVLCPGPLPWAGRCQPFSVWGSL